MAVAMAEETARMVTDVEAMLHTVEHTEQTSRSLPVHPVAHKLRTPGSLYDFHTGGSSHFGILDSYLDELEADAHSDKAGSCLEGGVIGGCNDVDSHMIDGSGDYMVRPKDEA